jgi:hypothetical protein
VTVERLEVVDIGRAAFGYRRVEVDMVCSLDAKVMGLVQTLVYPLTHAAVLCSSLRKFKNCASGSGRLMKYP